MTTSSRVSPFKGVPFLILGVVLILQLGVSQASSVHRHRHSRQAASESDPHEDNFCDSQGEGFHSHPSDCAKFVRCVEQGTRADGSPVLTRFNFYCAPGTVFDERISVCNWPSAVRGGEGCHAKSAQEIAEDSDNSDNMQKEGHGHGHGHGQSDDYMDKAWTTTTIVPTTATTTTTKRPPTTQRPRPRPEQVAASTEQPGEKEPRTDETTTTEWPSPGQTTMPPGAEAQMDDTDADGNVTTTEAVPTTTNMCQCNTTGTVRNRNVCDVESGQCACKKNVQGHECDQCTEGSFNLERDNPFGCTSCFCFGHSSVCQAASAAYNTAYIESKFERGTEYWGAENEHGDHISVLFSPFTQDIGVVAPADDDGQVYFVAPGRFLGDQRRSFGRTLNFTLRITENDPLQSSADVILEGGAGKVTMAIFGARNPLPSTRVQKYSLKLHPSEGWKPELEEQDFQALLSTLKAIKIRGTYTTKGTGYLDNVILETARPDVDGPPANWVEACTCPEGYAGQFCEYCTAGFTRTRDNANANESSKGHNRYEPDPFAECAPCNCSGRSNKCDPEFETCVECREGSSGDHCETCTQGFFLNPSTHHCEKCPCEEHEPVCELKGGTIFCNAFFNDAGTTTEPIPETTTAGVTEAGTTTVLPENLTTELPTTTLASTSQPAPPGAASDAPSACATGCGESLDADVNVNSDYDIDSQGLTSP